VEGGEILKQGTQYLDELGLKDNSMLIAEILDKVSTSTSRPKKAPKEEAKAVITYIVRENE
jgi:hypothetical protein